MQDSKRKQFVENVYREYGKAIFRYCYFRIADYDKAEDITAQVFLKFWAKVNDGEEIKKHKTLLYVIAHGLIIDEYRTKKGKNQVGLETIDERMLGYEDTVAESIDRNQAIEEVFQKLQGIKKEYKEILVLHYVEELTVKEISTVLQKKENAVRVLLHRALQVIKKQYE